MFAFIFCKIVTILLSDRVYVIIMGAGMIYIMGAGNTVSKP